MDSGPMAVSIPPDKALPMKYLLLFGLLPGTALAQVAGSNLPTTASWEYGLGLGNGAAVHVAHFRPRLMALVRVRGKWWRSADAPGGGLFNEPETRSRQFEAAALLGYPVVVGGSRLYAATGLGYVSGRQAGAYRYTIRTSGLLSSDPKNFYAHYQYQALGIPVEVGWQSPFLGPNKVRLGVAGQANFNPQQSVFCLLATVWFRVGKVYPPQSHE